MPPVDTVIGALERIDWNFPQSGNRRTSVHALHWFPGNYISQIPSFLIQILSVPGDVVCDPFVGSGTTAVEANLLGRHAVVSDRLSPCITLTLGKIQTLKSSSANQYFHNLIASMWWDGSCTSKDFGAHGEGSDSLLKNWYAARTLEELRYLWFVVENAPTDCHAILLAIFSDTLFACASTRSSHTATGRTRKHHWGWVADNVVPKPPIEHNAISYFRNRLATARDLTIQTATEGVGTLIVQQDARSMAIQSESIDLVVTSPPYIGVIDYAKANRLLYLWMGWRLDEERTEEIGARYKRTRKYFQSEYNKAMDASWTEITRILRRDAFCAIVIGESHRYQGTVEQLLLRWSQSMPLIWGPVPRTPQRRRVSDRDARLPIEFVCVFQKK